VLLESTLIREGKKEKRRKNTAILEKNLHRFRSPRKERRREEKKAKTGEKERQAAPSSV